MQNNKAQVIATLVRVLGVDANQLNAALSAPTISALTTVGMSTKGGK